MVTNKRPKVSEPASTLITEAEPVASTSAHVEEAVADEGEEEEEEEEAKDDDDADGDGEEEEEEAEEKAMGDEDADVDVDNIPDMPLEISAGTFVMLKNISSHPSLCDRVGRVERYNVVRDTPKWVVRMIPDEHVVNVPIKYLTLIPKDMRLRHRCSLFRAYYIYNIYIIDI